MVMMMVMFVSSNVMELYRVYKVKVRKASEHTLK